MTERILSPQHLNAFRENLIREEKVRQLLRSICGMRVLFLHIPLDRPLRRNTPFPISVLCRNRVMRSAPSIPCWPPSTVFWISWAGPTAR